MAEPHTAAHTALDGEWSVAFADSQPEAEFDQLVAATMRIGGLLLLTLAAVMLVVRRTSGALVQPLSPGSLLLLGCGLAVASLLVRQYVSSDPTTGMRTLRDRSMVLCPSAVVWLAAWAVLLPGTSTPAMLCLLGPLLIEEGGMLLVVLVHQRKRGTQATAATPRAVHRLNLRQQKMPLGRLPVGVWQQMSRSRRADGLDQCRGQVRVTFAAGQRTEIVHLAFCPPFAGQPQWSAGAAEGPLLSIKQVQVLPHGVRLEVRLDQVPRTASAVVLRFTATESRATQTAG